MRFTLSHVAFGFAALTSAIMTSSASQAAACGDVTIAEWNWASGEFMANVDKMILELGYGCSVEMIPGATQTTVASMLGKGQPDIASELWYNSNAEVLDQATVDGKVVNAGSSLVNGGIEGFWVPKYLVDKHPELATIDGVRSRPDLFPHPDGGDKGAWVGCPSGWNCQIVATNMFEFFGMADAGWELVDPGSAGGLDGSLTKAYERGEGWFGYYWAPTALLGRYQMVKVDPLTGINEDEFVNCVTQEGCKVTKGSDYPPGRVDTVVMADFADANPAIMEYFRKRGFTNPDMNAILYWKGENQADGETTAIYFLENYEDLWLDWVPSDIGERIKSNL